MDPILLLSAVNDSLSLGSFAKEKLKRTLTRNDYADDLQHLEKTFEEALQTHLTAQLTDVDTIDTDCIEDEWKAITTGLDSLDAIFESKISAIAHITDAIGTGLKLDLSKNEQLRGEVQIAVALAYNEAMIQFFDRVRDTERGKTLEREAQFRIAEAVDAIDESIDTILFQIRAFETRELINEGFERLDPLYFRTAERKNPVNAWRWGFELEHIAEGFALDRQRRIGHDERRSVTEEVLEYLHDDEKVVITGGPGSGKSTICMQVALRWYEQGIGQVFYRKADEAPDFSGGGALTTAIKAASGRVLVVAEDAIDEEMSGFHKLVRRFDDDPEVSFLTDARQTNWEDADDLLDSARLETQRLSFKRVKMPEFDLVETERAIKHFNSVAEDHSVEIQRSPRHIHKKLQSSDVGRPLYLSHILTRQSDDSDQGPEGVSPFEYDVRQAFRKVEQIDQYGEINHTVGLMINTLNAVRIPVYSTLIHTLGDDRGDRSTIKQTLDNIEGEIIIKREGSDLYQVRHEEWSMLYLERTLQELGVDFAADLFKDCVAIISKALDVLLEKNNGRSAASFRQIHTYRQRLVKNIGRIGYERPSLSPMLQNIGPKPPIDCSKETCCIWHDYRGLMFLEIDELSQADTAFDRVDEIVGEINEQSSNFDKRIKAWNALRKAAVARERDSIGEVKSYYKLSLKLAQETEDGYLEAMCHYLLGSIERNDELPSARNHFDQAADLYSKFEVSEYEFGAYIALVDVCQQQGDLDGCITYQEKGVEVLRELGWWEMAQQQQQLLDEFYTFKEHGEKFRKVVQGTELTDELREKLRECVSKHPFHDIENWPKLEK